jgi:hypothetical protein
VRRDRRATALQVAARSVTDVGDSLRRLRPPMRRWCCRRRIMHHRQLPTLPGQAPAHDQRVGHRVWNEERL